MKGHFVAQDYTLFNLVCSNFTVNINIIKEMFSVLVFVRDLKIAVHQFGVLMSQALSWHLQVEAVGLDSTGLNRCGSCS